MRERVKNVCVIYYCMQKNQAMVHRLALMIDFINKERGGYNVEGTKPKHRL